MASKKQKHKKSRIPGFIPDNRKSLIELLDSLKDKGVQIKVVTLSESLTYKKKNRIKPKLLGKGPHKNKVSLKVSLSQETYLMCKAHGYMPKKTKLKKKLRKIEKTLAKAEAKAKSLSRKYELSKKEKSRYSILKTSVKFGIKIAEIKRYKLINFKIISYGQDNKERCDT